MFTLPPNDDLDAWFQRLNAPLTHLPADERAQVHLEIRQHLEGLVAANEELGSPPEDAWRHALAQFGDPAKIGRRLAWEWRRGRGVLSPDMAAVLCGLAALPVVALVVALAVSPFPYTAFSDVAYSVGIPALAGTAVGLRHPQRALTGAAYSALCWPLLPALLYAGAGRDHLGPVERLQLLLGTLTWSVAYCGAAYLASARQRRQWYRPRWADLKLGLPSRAELMRHI